MIVYLDGPEKAGKTTLAQEILNGFEPDRSKSVKHSGADKANGLGYLRPLVAALNSPDVHVWDRGWLSEVIYGALLRQDRVLSQDPFMAEWYYGRLMEGRGGKFVLLPHATTELEARRDETDLPVSPLEEYLTFRDYANFWGYKLLVNFYDTPDLVANGMVGKHSALVGLHRLPIASYIGPRNPQITFVGDSLQELPFGPIPFLDGVSMEYFRQYGPAAILDFGYATIQALEEREKAPELFTNVVLLGERAKHAHPGFHSIHFDKMDSSKTNVDVFAAQLDVYLEGEHLWAG